MAIRWLVNWLRSPTRLSGLARLSGGHYGDGLEGSKGVLQQEHDAVRVRISRSLCASAPASAWEYRRFRAKSGPLAQRRRELGDSLSLDGAMGPACAGCDARALLQPTCVPGTHTHVHICSAQVFMFRDRRPSDATRVTSIIVRIRISWAWLRSQACAPAHLLSRSPLAWLLRKSCLMTGILTRPSPPRLAGQRAS